MANAGSYVTEPQKGYPYLTKGLLYRRARIAGEIEMLRAKLAELEMTLDRIDFTVQHFNPDATPDQLKPVKPYRRLKLFRQGELRKRVQEVLRKAENPLNAYDIAKGVLAMGGFDNHEVKEIEKRVRSNLWHLLQQNRVRVVKDARKAFYALVPADGAVRFKVGSTSRQRASG